MRNAALALAAILCAVPAALAQKNDFSLHDGDHVLFYGDSITDQRNYTMMIETYIVTRYPTMKVRFTNSGWGGDRVTGGGGGDIDLRLSRDVVPFKPSVITIMLGMNDGGYKAATEASDKAYFDGYRHIYQTLQKDVPGARITAIEPSPYDDVTRPPAFPVQGGIAYNDVMKAYGKWGEQLRQRESSDARRCEHRVRTDVGARQNRRSHPTPRRSLKITFIPPSAARS